jgi:hypothetical protein
MPVARTVRGVVAASAEDSVCYGSADGPSHRAERHGRLGPTRSRPRPGVDAVRAGGTAVDAAIAANAMLAVVYCNACGLGGDAFALVWEPGEGRLHGFNGSGRSPAALTIEAAPARRRRPPQPRLRGCIR